MRQPLNVLITVDAEVWPRTPGWRESALREDLRRDIYGATTTGAYGLPYQMDVLDAHGLKGVFFIEALCASAVGPEPLREVVKLVQDRGHEVQLHAHTEWLKWMEPSLLPGRTGQNLKDFAAEEQFILLGAALENLRAAGGTEVCAFRAGNYGANFDTLRALARLGIRYDTSHNTCYLNAECGLRTSGPELHPREIEGVWEFPIAYFQDWPGHYRHAQLCACSAAELRRTLVQAWQGGWSCYVLVSHGFELLRRRKQAGVTALADRAVIRRFESLCRFLGANRDMFRTAGFLDLDPAEIPPPTSTRPLRSNVARTALRFAEQVSRRVL
jgi:peptidoglycan/xylan/chitin deacetylase (PgdA/CDA1 family)